MKVAKTAIAGALLIELAPFCDDRGIFAEGYVRKKLADQGLDFDVQRVNLVKNERAGTVRGMHFQRDPWAQGKIVMAVHGRIFDAILDVRPDSPTYGKSYAVELVPQANALFMPRGIAHGCQALSDGASLLYLVDNDYMPSHERGIAPAGVVDWPLPLVNVAKRDLSWPTLKEWERNGYS
jgi:dTDP-4-dehydrorhamnose 3,5-epimerase